MEIRPIFGWRKYDWEFIVNPIVDIGFGRDSQNTFAPAARLAHKIGESTWVGFEYYTDLGPLEHFVPFNEQQHNIYAVADFKIGRFDINAGIGYGLTPGSDRWMGKIIIGTDRMSRRNRTNRQPRSNRCARRTVSAAPSRWLADLPHYRPVGNPRRYELFGEQVSTSQLRWASRRGQCRLPGLAVRIGAWT